MKNKKAELDVDCIGEQGRSLTKEEKLAISEYIRSKKAEKTKRNIRKVKSNARKRIGA